jgi:hypothetical protein
LRSIDPRQIEYYYSSILLTLRFIYSPESEYMTFDQYSEHGGPVGTRYDFMASLVLHSRAPRKLKPVMRARTKAY